MMGNQTVWQASFSVAPLLVLRGPPVLSMLCALSASTQAQLAPSKCFRTTLCKPRIRHNSEADSCLTDFLVQNILVLAFKGSDGDLIRGEGDSGYYSYHGPTPVADRMG